VKINSKKNASANTSTMGVEKSSGSPNFLEDRATTHWAYRNSLFLQGTNGEL